MVYPKYYPKEVVDFFCEHHNREHILEGIASGFGSDWEFVIENSTTAIKDRFAERMLIYRNSFKRTNKGAITLGWK